MILDVLSAASHYERFHPLFAQAFTWLVSTPLAQLPAGRHPIDGDLLFAMINHEQGREQKGAQFESHGRYIDIQYTIEGNELIGWRPINECKQVATPYDEAKDYALFFDKPEIWIPVTPGHFAIFWPHDAHAPLAGVGTIKKAVVKVAVNP